MVERLSRQNGFTLLELMVVLVIIGIATAMAGLGLGAVGAASAGLREDAMRLAHLFPLAQAEARSRGQPIVWTYDENGYRFQYLPRVLVLPLDRAGHGPVGRAGVVDHALLRPRAWSADGTLRVRVDPASAERFDGEWMPERMRIELSDGRNAVVIERHGNGRYEVLP